MVIEAACGGRLLLVLVSGEEKRQGHEQQRSRSQHASEDGNQHGVLSRGGGRVWIAGT
jgi:hypothetical protein